LQEVLETGEVLIQEDKGKKWGHNVVGKHWVA